MNNKHITKYNNKPKHHEGPLRGNKNQKTTISTRSDFNTEPNSMRGPNSVLAPRGVSAQTPDYFFEDFFRKHCSIAAMLGNPNLDLGLRGARAMHEDEWRHEDRNAYVDIDNEEWEEDDYEDGDEGEYLDGSYGEGYYGEEGDEHRLDEMIDEVVRQRIQNDIQREYESDLKVGMIKEEDEDDEWVDEE